MPGVGRQALGVKLWTSNLRGGWGPGLRAWVLGLTPAARGRRLQSTVAEDCQARRVANPKLQVSPYSGDRWCGI